MKIGIDIGGSHVGIGIVKNDTITAMKEKNLTRQDRSDIENNIINIIIDLLKQIMEENKIELKDIEFIGIASPGTIANNKIIQATNLGLKNFDIITKLQKYINVQMQIKNDSKCAALAEKYYGNMKNYNDCIFLCIGTGIGGAAFLNGEMLLANKFSGFEFGHMVINKGGRQCSCGKRGCFETYASIKAFKNKIAEILDIDNDFSGQYLRENLLDLSNEKIKDAVDQYVEDLSIGICNLIDIFEPEIIVLGGSFSHYENHPLYEKLIIKINEPDSRFNKVEAPKIELAKLKNNEGIIGATIQI